MLETWLEHRCVPRIKLNEKPARLGNVFPSRDYIETFIAIFVAWLGDERKLKKKGGIELSREGWFLPLSEEISLERRRTDSSQLQYFHDWTRRSSGWTAGIRDYVIVGRREQIWAEREREKESKRERGTYLVQIDLLLGIQVRTLEDRIVRVDRIVGSRDTGQNQHH